MLLFIHIAAASAWIGCVLTEAVFERLGADEAARRLISRAHWRIDLFVELPLLLVTAATGVELLLEFPWRPLLYVKAAIGAAAVLLNLYCVFLVWRRLRAAEAEDFTAWEAIDRQQHRYGAMVLAALVAALAFGGGLFVTR